MSERENFEEAAARLGYNLTMAEHETGEYHYLVTQDAWDMWQECCDKARQSESEELKAVRQLYEDALARERELQAKLQGGSEGGEAVYFYQSPDDEPNVWREVPLRTLEIHRQDSFFRNHKERMLYTGPPKPESAGVPESLVLQCESAVEHAAQKCGGTVNGVRTAQENIRKILSTTPKPDKWIACSERLPTEAEAGCDGSVWFTDKSGDGIQMDPILMHWSYVTKGSGHWKPTGLTRPTPPEQESE